jgi:transcription antitermination protein NusB
MGARTGGREAALKMLFAVEASQTDLDSAIALFWREFGGDPETRPYADESVRGVLEEREGLDETIRTASEHWRIERMTRVDRNVLRLGTWELKHRIDVPRAVVLDEAIELAKRYGSEESGAFVNGVLNQVAENLGRTDTDGAAPVDDDREPSNRDS